MRGQPDIFGEIHEDEIVKIAREAADERGYAIYDDYEEYMKQRMLREGLKLSNWDIPNIKFEIRGTLRAAGWVPSPKHPETRFYPPGTEQPNLGRSDTLRAGATKRR